MSLVLSWASPHHILYAIGTAIGGVFQLTPP